MMLSHGYRCLQRQQRENLSTGRLSFIVSIGFLVLSSLLSFHWYTPRPQFARTYVDWLL